MKYSQAKTMKAPSTGNGVMGNAGSVKAIMPTQFPDMKKIILQPSCNRGYDQQAWNYRY